MSAAESPLHTRPSPLHADAPSAPDLSAAASAALAQALGPQAAATLWTRCCARLATELPEQQYNTWIRPLPAAELSQLDEEWLLTVRVANRFMLDWIRTQYSQRLEAILRQEWPAPTRLELALAPRVQAAPIAPRAPAEGPSHGPRALPSNADQGLSRHPRHPGERGHNQGHEHGSAGRAGMPPPRSTPQSMGLNASLTFDNLVPGRANQMARTAALHVAGAPGQMYNPLFIYGGVGLGKTHLMNAVGNALLADRPDARILYLHAEQFISDVVKNYQRKTFDELKAKYHSLDLLLIDDVQFFAGKDRTQEEFFNAFEALLAKKAHIIMTSDTYPKGLANIDERLTSRFDAGLTVAIEPPELEMRVAILIKKSDNEGVSMPEDVAFFVAKNVRANVRELEGALRKVLAFAKFSHKEITITLAREALKDLLSIQNRQISVENIQKTVADFYKIKVADMYSKKRPASIAKPRQIAMYLAKELTQKSLPEIGELFGGRDHTTVLHAVRKIAGERGKDSEINQQLHVLEQTLKG